MLSRIDLHNKLKSLIGNNNVYLQPPENYKLQYPCVLYTPEVGNVTKANNRIYKYDKCYTLTFIYPDFRENIETIFLSAFEYCTLNRMFVSDNLYHYVFTIYF